ncbi:MAG TPA: DEAD/DEAH box helicase [Methanofastidiosum sp.]|nr:DEAD/DEAH box helicase [Methanofastidiosum sp.]
MKLEYDGSVIRLYPGYQSLKHILRTLPMWSYYDATRRCYVYPESAVLTLCTVFPDATTNEAFIELLKKHERFYRDVVHIKEGKRTLEDFGITLKGLKNKHLLREYQVTGVLFAFHGKKVLLADDMGLGKALMAISTFLALKEKHNIRKVLIVCPNSIKYSVWAHEIKKWTKLHSTVVDGNKKQRISLLQNIKSTFVIINYEAIRVLSKYIKEWQPDMVVLDECHAIKNRKAKQTLAIKEIKAPYRLLLTGTPVLNRVEELWSQLNYLDELYWFSYGKFVQRYCTFKEQWLPHVRRTVKIISGYQNLDELKEHLYCYYFRRTKNEVLTELPDRVYETRLLDLTLQQKQKYNELVDECVCELDKTTSFTTFAARLQKLLQVCDFEEGSCESSKFDECEKIYNELKEEHKIVYFTWYVKTAQMLKKRLELLAKKDGYTVVEIDGTTPVEERTKSVDKFTNDSNCKVFIATIATCGLGLNLTASDVCVFVSRSFTPAINDQAESRLHRQGQKKTVNIVILKTRNTVEERVEHILRKKEILFEDLFKDSENLEQIFKKVE